MATYRLSGTITNVEVDEEEIKEYSCNYCGTCIKKMKFPILHEDAYGEYFCEELECIWEHVNDTYIVEIDHIIDGGKEEG